MSKIHKLYRNCVVKTDIETAWNFISSPQNLKKLTPEKLPLEFISELPDKMHDGLLIEFRVGIPLMGKQTWLTEIKHIHEQQSFIDDQRVGPYKLWHHCHEIQPEGDRVRFIDRVHYSLPLGPLGTLAHALFVKKMLSRIFDYREQKIHELLES